MSQLHYTKHYPTYLIQYARAGLNVLCVVILLFFSGSFANNFSLGYAGLEPAELDLAESVILKRIEADPNNTQLQLDLAFINYYLDNLEEALDSFLILSANEDLQTNPNLFYGLALTQHRREHPQAALKNIVIAYNLAPENYEIVKLYADISHTMNLHQSILEAYDTQANVNVILPEVKNEEAQEIKFTFKNALKAYKANNLVASRQQLEALLGDRPDDIDAMVLLAFVLYREGNSEEAEAIFADLASRENFNENSDVLYGLALSQRNLGKEVEAFENILRAIVATTTREDLLALYRSLALELTKEPEELVDEPTSAPKVAEETSNELSLKDVVADISELENFDKVP